MNGPAPLSDIHDTNLTAPKSLENLIVELEHYRRQSEWLSMINDLYIRLAGAVDVTSMIEAFSIWLMPMVEHDLIAYNNPARKRTHMFCSCHGPERRLVMKAAKKMFTHFSVLNDSWSWREGEYFVENLRLNSLKGEGCLLLLRYGNPVKLPENNLLQEVLEIINESLLRSLDYENIFEQSRRDSLTGLANRRVFEERIEQLIDSCRRYGHPVTMASMDLDKFKQLNDSLGHTEGDLALQKVARTMAKMVRNSDLLVRMGGDEFILVMQDTGLQAARNLAERLCLAVDQLNIRTSEGLKLGISIGLAQWQPGMTKDEWLQLADETLYHAKATGRSKVCLAASR